VIYRDAMSAIDPRQDPGRLRVGHPERQQAVDALAEHFSLGRLEPAEFEQRTAAAWAARTRGELDALFHDLPALPPPPAPYPGSPPAPYGRDGATGMPLSDKQKWVAGVLQLVLPFGTGRLYSGRVGLGITQLGVSLFFAMPLLTGRSPAALVVPVLWCWLDGIAILTGRPADGHGRLLR
jgi:Domain of unknown function (DUF1707)./TM2 domain.